MHQLSALTVIIYRLHDSILGLISIVVIDWKSI